MSASARVAVTERYAGGAAKPGYRIDDLLDHDRLLDAAGGIRPLRHGAKISLRGRAQAFRDICGLADDRRVVDGTANLDVAADGADRLDGLGVRSGGYVGRAPDDGDVDQIAADFDATCGCRAGDDQGEKILAAKSLLFVVIGSVLFRSCTTSSRAVSPLHTVGRPTWGEWMRKKFPAICEFVVEAAGPWGCARLRTGQRKRTRAFGIRVR